MFRSRTTGVIVFYLLIKLCVCIRIKMPRNTHHDHIRNLTKNDGYPVEAHRVVTDDGYILTTYRIPSGRNTTAIKNHIPILLTHGMGGTSEFFLLNGPTKSAAYYFANKGYDVWLINTRGTRHSRKHKTLSVHQKEYWNFSFHEVAVFDVPANIDYILNITMQSKLIFVGYSMGTTVYFVTASARPEYNEKIIVAIQLGPSALRSHFKETFLPFYSMAKAHRALEKMFHDIGIYELLPYNEELREFILVACQLNIISGICDIVLDMIGGAHSRLTNRNLIPTVFQHLPAGSSVRQLIHYFQNMATGNFSQYDYGPEKNLEVYNTTYPPIYNLSLATAPIALIYSRYDWFSENEIDSMINILPNVYWVYEVPDARYNHIDLVLADDVIPLVLDPLYEKIKDLK